MVFWTPVQFPIIGNKLINENKLSQVYEFKYWLVCIFNVV